MKRNNKGFTLAELLIVIAIIAILIAIAIPVFAGQLDNARIQTDHANIRSAYAMAQVANLEGFVYTGTDGTTIMDPTTTSTFPSDGIFTFQADGSLAVGTGTSPYKLKATVKPADRATKCASSAVCAKDSTASANTHTVNASIKIVYSATATPVWQVQLS